MKLSYSTNLSNVRIDLNTRFDSFQLFRCFCLNMPKDFILKFNDLICFRSYLISSSLGYFLKHSLINSLLQTDNLLYGFTVHPLLHTIFSAWQHTSTIDSNMGTVMFLLLLLHSWYSQLFNREPSLLKLLLTLFLREFSLLYKSKLTCWENACE